MQQVSFAYEGSYDDVFTDLSFQVDTDWRLGLIGRNGRGKTTLLRMLAGELHARGADVRSASARAVSLRRADSRSRHRTGMLSGFAPDEPEWRLEAEADLLGLDDGTAFPSV